MMMINKVTKQQGEWVTIEGLEFLEVDGNYIKKDNVGEDWIEFNDQTTEMLLELVDGVANDEDVSFMIIEHLGDGAHVLGHRVSDQMVLGFITTLIENFVQDDPIKTVMLMLAIQEIIMEDE